MRAQARSRYRAHIRSTGRHSRQDVDVPSGAHDRHGEVDGLGLAHGFDDRVDHPSVGRLSDVRLDVVRRQRNRTECRRQLPTAGHWVDGEDDRGPMA